MRRPVALLLLGITVMALGVRHISAASLCGPIGCRAYISNRPVQPQGQQTLVWCWAASISAIFDYYGHPLEQYKIVQRVYGKVIPAPGAPRLMAQALNATWVDDNNVQFTVESPITDMAPGGPKQVNNADIVNAIANDIPVFYADQTHAMVLVQTDYRPTPYGPQIMAGVAVDPAPRMPVFQFSCPPNPLPCVSPVGARALAPGELVGSFAAIPNVW